MIGILFDPQGELLSSRYLVHTSWQVYDEVSATLLAQIAARIELITRLSLSSISLPLVFKRYDLAENEENLTRLLSILSEEVQKLVRRCQEFLDPALTPIQRANLLEELRLHYPDCVTLLPTEAVLRSEWALMGLARPSS